METRASYILVGLFVLGLLTAGVGYGLWLARPQGTQQVFYLVRFDEDVTGLRVGSDARFHGVRVGEVSAIRIVGEPEHVEVTLQIDKGTPIRRNTVARLEVLGITGATFIQLQRGSEVVGAANGDDDRLLEERSKPPYPEIPAELSELQQVFKEFPRVLGEIKSAAQQMAELLNEKNLDSISRSLESVQSLTESISKQSSSIETIFTKVENTLDRAEDTLLAIKDLSGKVDGAIGDVKKGVNAFEKMTTTVNAFVSENRRPVADFSATGLYEMTQFLIDARGLVQSLNRIISKIEQDPARFLFGDPHQGYQAR